MGLNDRIARRRVDAVPQDAAERAPGPDGAGAAAPVRAVDPLAEVRRRVHQALLDVLGPQMYADVGGDDDLRRRVRETIGEVLAGEETPLTAADRARIADEVADDILGHGPLEPRCATPTSARSWSTART
ncbi:hypothetical protein [Planobispora longispora]|uniref:hypothetical protein n=1 Tax=Planobispora longispora TaxID=28887 RepID=UPI00360AA917|nr:hypothetical protein GCM10020093_118460 [Planobispora longispora]